MNSRNNGDLFETEAVTDKYFRELQNYHDKVRREVEKRIILTGGGLGIVVGIGFFILVEGNVELPLPDFFPGFQYVLVAGILFWLVGVVSAVGFSDWIYGWALKKRLTDDLVQLCNGFGESRTAHLNSAIGGVLGETDLVEIQAKFRPEWNEITFPCTTRGVVGFYVAFAAGVTGAAVVGLLSWLF